MNDTLEIPQRRPRWAPEMPMEVVMDDFGMLMALTGVLGLVFLSYLVEALRPVPQAPPRLVWDAELPIRYTRPGGGGLRYVTTGAGPSLVLLHTIRTELDVFQKTIPELSRHFEVYALDYPGHGYSDIPEVAYTPEFFTDAVGGFLDELEIRDAIVVGESIGGAIALRLAARRHPRLRQVIAVNPYDYARGRGVMRSSLAARAVFGLSNVPAVGASVWRLRTYWVFRSVMQGGVHRGGAIPRPLMREMNAVGSRPGHSTRAMLSGIHLSTYRKGDHQVPVLLRTTREKRRDPDDLSAIFVNGRDGKVPLDSIATLVSSWEPAVIARRNHLPTVTVGAHVEDGLLANVVAAQIRPPLEAMLAGLPPGCYLEQGGEQEETVKAQVQVVRAVGLAMVSILLVLVAQYNSFLKPLVILFTVPMALIGVLVGLFVTDWAMGLMAMLGVLSLAGIVINNAIVLIDFIQAKVAEGQPLRDAVAAAGRVRIRPIVLTSLTTIGGLLPLSLFGGALWAPMTNSMIFGLIFSTGFTLIVVPVLYVLFVERLHMAAR